MAKLTEEEQAQFDALTKKQEEPEPAAGGGRSEAVSIVIDLADEAAVERGLKLGYLTQADLNGDDGDDDEEDGDDGGKDKDTDGAPNRKRKNVLTRGYGDE